MRQQCLLVGKRGRCWGRSVLCLLARSSWCQQQAPSKGIVRVPCEHPVAQPLLGSCLLLRSPWTCPALRRPGEFRDAQTAFPYTPPVNALDGAAPDGTATGHPPLLRQVSACHVLGCFLEAFGLQEGNSPQHTHQVVAGNLSCRAFTAPISHFSVLANCGYHAVWWGRLSLAPVALCPNEHKSTAEKKCSQCEEFS